MPSKLRSSSLYLILTNLMCFTVPHTASKNMWNWVEKEAGLLDILCMGSWDASPALVSHWYTIIVAVGIYHLKNHDDNDNDNKNKNKKKKKKNTAFFNLITVRRHWLKPRTSKVVKSVFQVPSLEWSKLNFKSFFWSRIRNNLILSPFKPQLLFWTREAFSLGGKSPSKFFWLGG